MLTIFALQLAVPLSLILWLAVAPASSRGALTIQAIATALALLAIALAGVWLFPPWWAPWLYAVLFVFAAMKAWRKRRDTAWLPPNWRHWCVPIVFLVIGGYGASEASHIFVGRTSPTRSHVDMAFPLLGGSFLVLNGGSDVRINSHQKTMHTNEPRLLAWRGNAYGVDFVAIDHWGMRAPGVQPIDPSRYLIFGMPVLAPCSGTVATAVDGLPDMIVPQYDRANMAGNYVILVCDNVHVVMAHFKEGSVLARTGEIVHIGQKLAEVGNSGGTDEPHLHIHAQLPGTSDAPISGDPIPMRFDNRFLVRGDRVVDR